MEYEKAIAEYRADWLLRGQSARTVREYERYLDALFRRGVSFNVHEINRWLLSIESNAVRRQAARAVRSFGKFLESCGDARASWWRRVPLPREIVRPQPTVTVRQYEAAKRICTEPRECLILELLWSTGVRRSELANLRREDIDLASESILVMQAKNRRPRRVPLSAEAKAILELYEVSTYDKTLLGLSPAGVSAVIKRLGLPSAHAWRRGWAVESLRCGVSEASVRTTAGWSSGAMVSRYTAALSEELALTEFARIRNQDYSGDFKPSCPN